MAAGNTPTLTRSCVFALLLLQALALRAYVLDTHNSTADDHSGLHVNCSDHADKAEQILWDIFVDEDDALASDDDPEAALDDAPTASEESQDAVLNDDASEETFESMIADSIAEEENHTIRKRSADDSPEERSNRRKRPQKKTNTKKLTPTSNSKKGKKRAKGKKSVEKYNEYMDVVLKRMNSMIKSKHMDPLMVNLFSGANQGKPQGEAKKKKKGKKQQKAVGKKKRKNKGRMEELEDLDPEGRSGSSDSDSSAIELDNEHERVHGGVFIRRVGVLEDSSGEEEEDDDENVGSEVDAERAFRQIRALIVNGSMKRSADSNATTAPPAPSTSPSTTQKLATEEPRGFDKSPPSSEESPRKKQGGGGGGKGKKPAKKPAVQQKKPRATRGVLKGLSSLKRSGDVDVVRQGDNVRVVRSRFTLGPVTLEIVPRGGGGAGGKEEGRGKKNKQGDPKVTAVAKELKGVIEVRLKKHSPTSIRKLRVFPPNSVKIKPTSKGSKPKGAGSVPRYNRVTPVATHRLRQIASAVVKQADVKRKSSGIIETSRGAGQRTSRPRVKKP